MGVDFNFAKAVGLFANGTTTIATSMRNINNKLLDIEEISKFILLSIIFATLGAYSSNYIDENIVKFLLVLFILVSLSFIYMSYKPKLHNKRSYAKLYIFISITAFVGGLIGVGGGIIYLPLFIYAGFRTKESIVLTSALIPFVSFSAFFTYTSFINIDYIFLIVVGVGAILGGYFGNIIMHKIKNEKNLKAFISILLLFIALDMLYINFINR
jgi:uncharacterized membrane protein YfcA